MEINKNYLAHPGSSFTGFASEQVPNDGWKFKNETYWNILKEINHSMLFCFNNKLKLGSKSGTN